MMLRVGYRWCDDPFSTNCNILRLVGRLAPGRTLDEANSEFAALLPAAWRVASVGANRGISIHPPHGMSEDSNDPRLIAMLAAAAVALWAVSCLNLAGLLTARARARQSEFAIRSALGASSLRLVRQIVTESLMLGALGGGAGALVARGFVAVLASKFFSWDDEGHLLVYDFSQSMTIVWLTLGAAVVAAIGFSLWPAMRVVGRTRLVVAPRTVSHRWTAAGWLLGAQAAAAVAMIATASLLAASARLLLVGHNYETSHVALMRVRPRLLKSTLTGRSGYKAR